MECTLHDALNSEKKSEDGKCNCTICYEEMKTLEFEGVQDMDIVDLHDPTCLRLKCGHAFHTNCILQAFRSNLKCPVCRNDLVDGNTPHENFIQFIDEEPEEEIPQHEFLIQSVINQERTRNAQVKELRKDLKKTVKEFNTYHTDLKHKRRALICKMLREFRKSEHGEFRKSVRKVQKKATALMKVEKALVVDRLVKENIVASDWNDRYFNYSEEYDSYYLLQKNGADNLSGFSRRFWK